MKYELFGCVLLLIGVYGEVVYIQGVLRDQAPDTMKTCGTGGSAGMANGTYGFVGTDFQLPLGSYFPNEKDLVGKQCSSANGWSATQCGRIGGDRTPVYAYPGISPGHNVRSPSTFYNWFHNSPQTHNIIFSIPLTNDGTGMYRYSNSSFFPLDNLGWKDHCPDTNEQQRNFAFCFESHFKFTYLGGETLTITCDDDLWVYINDYLVMDLGSLHPELEMSVHLDSLHVGLVHGNSYTIDLFHCDRHTETSTLIIQTNIVPFCGEVDWCGVCEGTGQSCCTPELIQIFCNDNNSSTVDTCSRLVPPNIGCDHTPK